MVAVRGRRVERQEFPNLSLMSGVVLFMSFWYMVRELFSHVCLPYSIPATLNCLVTYDTQELRFSPGRCDYLSLHSVHQKSPVSALLAKGHSW